MHLLLLMSLGNLFVSHLVFSDDTLNKHPTVTIAVLVRNKEHSLPYFFGCLNRLNYPKERILLWFATDHNEDNSLEALRSWVAIYGQEYHEVVLKTDASEDKYPDQEEYKYWSPSHYEHVIELRQEALDYARYRWSDYLFMLDADVYLTEPNTLEFLVMKQEPIIAPMLHSQGMYSNFWGAMTPEFYYQRSDDYEQLVMRHEQGCFEVPMIHSAVLMDLRSQVSDHLTYDPARTTQHYVGPNDDIIAFAINTKLIGLTLQVCNDHLYGFISQPLEGDGDPILDQDKLLNVRMQALGRGIVIPVDPPFTPAFAKKTTYNCDTIYMINLARRSRRRELMLHSFEVLGMEIEIYPAVDGALLDITNLSHIKPMPEYRDPYHDRGMKAGEVGCFLSHYNIWTEVVEEGKQMVMILEDDIHFVSDFKKLYYTLLADLEHLEWDLVYLGRKVLMPQSEAAVTSRIVKPKYSYWTLGYLLSNRGAKKLLHANPLANLLPVDEFLPIMYDEHPK